MRPKLFLLALAVVLLATSYAPQDSHAANALADFDFSNGAFKTDRFKRWFDKAQIGDEYVYETGVGDGCNTCTGSARKVSESEMGFLQIGRCTLVNCSVAWPTYRVR